MIPMCIALSDWILGVVSATNWDWFYYFNLCLQSLLALPVV